MCLQNLMKFYHYLINVLRKTQNVEEYDLQRATTPNELAPRPYFPIINVISMYLPNVMKFYHCLFKILKNQNVADGRADG